MYWEGYGVPEADGGGEKEEWRVSVEVCRTISCCSLDGLMLAFRDCGAFLGLEVNQALSDCVRHHSLCYSPCGV